MVKARYLLLSDPDPGYKVYIVTPREEAIIDRIAVDLMKLGCFEVVKPSEAKAEIEYKGIREYYNILEEAKKLYNIYVANIEKEIVVEIHAIPQPDEFKNVLKNTVEKLRGAVSNIEALNSAIDEKSRVITELRMLREVIAELLTRYGDIDTSIMRFNGTDIVVDTFYGSQDSISRAKTFSMYTIAEKGYGDRIISIMLFSRRGYEKLLRSDIKDLKRFEYVDKIRGYRLREALNRVDNEIATLLNEVESYRNRKKEIVSKYLDDIAILKTILDNEYEKISIIYGALTSKYLTVLVGYTAKSKIDTINNYLSKSYPIHIVVEKAPEPVVDFNNLKAYKPYELITEFYGYPSPSEWDPTPLLTYAFTLFFSLMLADIGYAIGLALATKYVLPKLVEDPTTEGFRKFQRMLYILSGSTIVVGLLSKSFFGDLLGRYIPLPLVINTGNILFMMGLSLLIGLIWVTIAHIIALAKSLYMKDYGGLLVEMGMVLLLISGPLWIMYSYRNIVNVGGVEMLGRYMTPITIMIAIGIILLVIGRIKTMGIPGSFLWIFDITGAMGDIFSFMRIAGISAGTTLLISIFNSLIYNIYSSFATNIVIGMVVGIIAAMGMHFFLFILSPVGPFAHSLRLCMYEILTKFYEGGGRRLQPVKIRISPRLLLRK